MAVTAYSTNSEIPVNLTLAAPTVVIRLRLPPTGTFVVWGKMLFATSGPPTAQVGTVEMTTLDGGTTLDVAGFSFDADTRGHVSVSLQSTLDLSLPTSNEIVDIRCTAYGTTTSASLIAIPVDALSGPVGPGS